MKIITPAILITALLATPACGDDRDVDCGVLATHQAELLVDMLPSDMRPNARKRVGDQREAIEARCNVAPPTESLARCQLAASDIREHRLCAHAEGRE